jgi:hypothetical protein
MAIMSRQEAGRKGADALNKDLLKKSAAAKKAAATRKRKNPDEFKIMGQKGGRHSHIGSHKDMQRDTQKDH